MDTSMSCQTLQSVNAPSLVLLRALQATNIQFIDISERIRSEKARLTDSVQPAMQDGSTSPRSSFVHWCNHDPLVQYRVIPLTGVKAAGAVVPSESIYTVLNKRVNIRIHLHRIHIYLHLHVYIYTCIYTYILTYKHLHLHVCIYLHVYIYTHMYTYTPTCVNMHYTCRYICIHVYI